MRRTPPGRIVAGAAATVALACAGALPAAGPAAAALPVTPAATDAGRPGWIVHDMRGEQPADTAVSRPAVVPSPQPMVPRAVQPAVSSAGATRPVDVTVNITLPAVTPTAAKRSALGPAAAAVARPAGPQTSTGPAAPAAPGAVQAPEVLLARPGVTAPRQTLTDLPYAGLSAAQKLDLHLPNRSGQAVPVIVFIHGGAFSGGDKSEVIEVARLLDEGYAVASVNYRLSGEAPFPAAVQDAKAAVRWLRAHAEEYGLDPTRFAAWGTSAGGYLASMVGVSGGQYSGLDDPALGNAEVSSQVQAVVSWYGPSDFTAMDAQARQVPGCGSTAEQHDAPGSPESSWLRAPVQAAPLARASNPIAWLASAPAGTVPPFLLAHGGEDCAVPPGQSTVLGAALTSAGAPATVTVVDGAGHADEGLHRQLLAPSLEFVARSLGRRPGPPG